MNYFLLLIAIGTHMLASLAISDEATHMLIISIRSFRMIRAVRYLLPVRMAHAFLVNFTANHITI